MHFLGLAGMPRRIPDYPDAYTGWNVIASYGSIVSIIATFIFLYGLYIMYVEKNVVTGNYWYSPNFFESQLIDSNIKKAESTSSLEFVTPMAFHTHTQNPSL